MKLLLLAGTGEARRIAEALAQMGVAAVASVAGATRTMEPLALPTRTGGFGGEEGFLRTVAEEKITHVLDATHPFAHRISLRTAAICAASGIPYLQVLRPEWEPVEGEEWHFIDHEEEAAKLIPRGQTVFLATGRQSLEKFAGLEGRRVLLRQIDPPTEPLPFEGGEFIIGRPPFSLPSEIDLFGRLAVDWLVVKNAGGEASATKLEAARRLKIPVIMIRRPPQPDAPKVETEEDALEQVKRWMNGA